MNTEYVLDSSVIAAIFFQEPSSKKAARAIKHSKLLTVDLARAEVANVAWKRVHLFGEDLKLNSQALKLCMDFIDTSCEIILTQELWSDSFKLAIEKKITFYDALFVTAAEQEQIPLLTLDRQLQRSSELVKLL